MPSVRLSQTKVHSPSVEAVVVSETPEIVIEISLLGSAVPVSVGFKLFVANGSNVGAFGAVVSITNAAVAWAELSFDELVAVALMVYVPSASVVVDGVCHVPSLPAVMV